MTSHKVSNPLPQIPLFSPNATEEMEHSNGNFNSMAAVQSPYSESILFFLGTILCKNPATEKPDP